jgi:large subunit ribosomal protein L29
MRSSDIQNMHDIELVEKLKEARQEAFNLRLRHATGELENTAGLREAKRDVARLLTIARQRNIDLEREQSSN